MKFGVLDFETYYDDVYTLSKMTTEAYIRDGRFKMHCVGIKSMDSLPAPSHPPAHPTMTMDDATFRRAGAPQVSKYGMVCYNAAFDGLILSHHYGVAPAFWFDTLSMARLVFPHDKSISLESLAHKFGLPPKSVPYNAFRGVRDVLQVPELYDQLAGGCAHDVELTYIIFRHLLPLVPREELKLIDLTIRMFTEPRMDLDTPRMEVYHAKVIADKEATLAQLGVTKEDLQSSARFADLLRQLGTIPPTKPSPRSPTKLIYAFAKTDEAMKELCDDEDERVAALCTARLGAKSTGEETRCRRLLDMRSRGAITVPLRYYGASTSRWAGEDQVNFQNFKRGGAIRQCLTAQPGSVLVVGDLAQIECRVLNWLAGEQWVLDAFRQKRDLYSEIAAQFYQRPIDKRSPAERGLGKQIELSCGFGSGGSKICITARRGTYGPSVTLTAAQGIAARDLYRNTHPKVVDAWGTGKNILSTLFRGEETAWGPMLIRDHRVYGPGGAWLDYTNLNYEGVDKWGKPEYSTNSRRGKSRIYGSKFVQNVVEFLSRLILAKAMLEVKQHWPVIWCTHDEMVAAAPAAEGPAALEFMLNAMKTPPAWCPDLPLDAEGAFDVRYAK